MNFLLTFPLILEYSTAIYWNFSFLLFMSNLRSMTAFARSSHSSEQGILTFLVQSINRPFLEMNFQLPPFFSSYESLLRKQFSLQVGRGALTIRVTFIPHSTQAQEVIPNLPFAKGIKKGWEEIQKELAFEGEITLALLASHKEELFLYRKEDEENRYEDVLTLVSKQVLHKLMQMKEAEGAALLEELLHRIGLLENYLLEIEKRAPQAVESYRAKLQEKMAALFKEPVTDERILKEIALFAEKIDITEEIIRLRSHFQQVREFLQAPLRDALDTKGKKLDFFAQEMLREVNTIGSKSLDKNVIHLVIECKSELEKFKEQSRNIE